MFSAVIGLFFTMLFGSTNIVYVEETDGIELDVEFVNSLHGFIQDSFGCF